HLEGGTRLAYGARALTKGGLQSLPHPVFPGGLLLGDDAGLLNFLKLKGSHTAMKSGMLAAEAVIDACSNGIGNAPELLQAYQQKLDTSWIHRELHRSRNCAPALHKFGTLLGSAFCFVDQSIFRGRLPFTLKDRIPDHATLKPASASEQIV